MANSRNGVLLRHYQTLFSIGTVGTLSDKDLIERFKRRDGEAADLAFAALVDRHGPMVLRTCRAILRDEPPLADDAFQTTFLVLVRRAGGLWIKDSIGPWLHEVACKTARSLRIAAIVRRSHEEQASAKSEAVEEPLADDLGAVLHSEIDRLPERYRVVVLLCLLEGLTREQAARQLGWPVGTVQSRLARGRERLQKTLIRRGVVPSIGITLTGYSLGSASAAAVPASLFEATVRIALDFNTQQTTASRIATTLAVLFETWKGTQMLTRLKISAVLLTGAGLMTTAAGVLAQQGERGKPAAKVSEPMGKGEQGPAAKALVHKPMPPYVVEAPDVLNITVAKDLPGHPISGEFLVRPDGTISLDYAGDIPVTGLTVPEIKLKLIEHLSDFLDNEHLGLEEKGPDGATKRIDAEKSKQVAVSVVAYNSKVYYVQGLVASPGRIPVTGNETVLDAINFAGGLTRAADPAVIELVRVEATSPPTRTILPVDLNAIISKGDTTTNYQIHPGDRIIVHGSYPNRRWVDIAASVEESPDHNPKKTRPLEDRPDAVERKLDLEKLVTEINEALVNMAKPKDIEDRLEALERKLDLLLEKVDRLQPKDKP